ncbi:MAG: translin family protein [Euryarchaeota archaeon]|nr:translin family protein [Euryarchaeota archaeon]
MKGIRRIADRLERVLTARDQARERGIVSARAITRLSGDSVRALHAGRDERIALAAATSEAARLKRVLAKYPDLYFAGFAIDALAELAEAAVVRSIARGLPVPLPRDINVPEDAYLLGLGDAIGELRRLSLDCMRRSDHALASKRVEEMEMLFEILMRFNHTSALGALRRKQDVARGLIEKTRGELQVSAENAQLRRKLAQLERALASKRKS